MHASSRAVLVALASTVSAQVPPHAVVLNPTIAAVYGTRIVQADGFVHAVSYAPRSATTGDAIYAHSLDGGRTWPRREVVLATGGPGPIAADGTRVVAIVYPNGPHPHVVRSSDAGVTWSAPVRIGTSTSGTGTFDTALSVQGSTALVVWNDVRGNGWLWANRSTDGGATWGPEMRLDASTPVRAQNGVNLHLAAHGPLVHVLWREDIVGTHEVWYRGSTDGGATWNAPRLLSLGPLTSFVAEGISLLVGTRPAQRSDDGGMTWQAFGVPGLSEPFFAGAGGRVLATANVLNGDRSVTVLASTSPDQGRTWQPAPAVALRTPPAIGSGADPIPFVRGDVFYVHARFATPFGSRVLQSIDDGASWRALQGDDTLLTSNDERIVAVHEAALVHAYVLLGHSGVGAGTSGTSGFVPSLRGLANPTPGGTFILAVGDALGGSFGVLAVAFAPPTAIRIGGATIHVQPPLVSLGFPTGGNAGIGGTGSFRLPIRVPNRPSLAGLTLVSQAVVADPANADGFAATRALETWVR